MAEHTLYTTDINIEDYRESFKDSYEREPENDDELYEYAYSSKEFDFQYAEDNLNFRLPENLLAVGSVGTWRGRRSGYKELKDNLNECLRCWSSCDYLTIKVDTKTKKLEGVGHHHDGSNYMEFRVWKPGVTDSQKNRLLGQIYEGNSCPNMLNRYTHSAYKYVKQLGII